MGCCASTERPKVRPESAIYDSKIIAEGDMPHPHYSVSHAAAEHYFQIENKEFDDVLKECLQQGEKQKRQQILTAVMDRFEQLQAAYNQHNIDRCMELIADIKKNGSVIDLDLIDNGSTKKEVLDMMGKVQLQYGQLQIFLGYLNNVNWKFEGEEDSLRVSTLDNSETLSFRFEIELGLPVEIFLMTLMEIDLYRELVSEIKESNEEKYVGRNRRIGYCSFQFPIIKNREVFFEGIGYNRLKYNDTLLMYCRSIHNRPDICQQLDYKVRVNPANLQADFNYIVVRYDPICVGRGKLTLVMDIDVKVDFVPLFMLKVVCKKFCKDLVQKVLKVSEEFKGSIWEKKMKEKPETFNFFKNSIADYFQQKQSMRNI